MEFTQLVTEKFEKFEEDSAVLKGLRERANDMGHVTIGEALDELARYENRGH